MRGEVVVAMHCIAVNKLIILVVGFSIEVYKNHRYITSEFFKILADPLTRLVIGQKSLQ